MGWAVDSQPCMGNIPALVPKPTMVTNRMASSSGPPAAAASGDSEPPGTNTGEEAAPVKKNSPKRPIIAPATEYSRYFRPAATASRVMLCSTSTTENSVMASKNRYIVTIVPASPRPKRADKVSR